MFPNFYNIINIEKNDKGFIANIRLNGEHYIYKAHFPGNPITPGVCLLQIATELLGKFYGCDLMMRRASNVKYLQMVTPVERTDYSYNCVCGKEGNSIKASFIISGANKVYTKMNMEFEVQNGVDLHCTGTGDIFKEMKILLLIPTYNNASKLGGVIDSLLKYTDNIVVVNDGSTDNTPEILKKYDGIIRIIDYPNNKGKGYAIKQGFKYGIEQKQNYMISIDSDGQHKPEDLAYFVKAIEQHPDSIIIGSRVLEHENKAKGSVFANKFANFWFKVQTSKNCSDTQSGYRAYPLNEIKRMSLITNRYEFELEVLVRAAWRNIPIKTIPIDVYYPPKEERISHFRPFRDFGRVSVLNTVLVFAALLYGYPSILIRKIF